MSEGDMSPAELGRAVGRLEVAISAGFASMEEKLDKYVLQSVHQAEMRNVETKFTEVEKDVAAVLAEVANFQTRQRWVVGTLLTAIGVVIAGAALIVNYLT